VEIKKNPLDIDETMDCPRCFSNYDEDDRNCSEHCPFSSDCANETEQEKEYRNISKLVDGRPVCFGQYYSPIGPTCQLKCNFATECDQASEFQINQSLSKPVIASSLQVLTGQAPKVSSTAIRSPSLSVIGDPYRPYTYNTTTPQTVGLGGTTTIRQPPALTNERAIELYGVPLHPNPVLPGQFINEAWYERFGKLFVLNTGESFSLLIKQNQSGFYYGYI
jgi:hypothetical protein